ncbi:hypothetical protein L228DRAFT_244304 [Xylona heveae TC161]|uniref:STEEP1 domain-containing protein n=1 Tax=Xylona heveae (strain CBS 132557 / TC161) TaxID=1328760 RepID=A0A165IW10_XYLHT|nr:hypothetical protein L228DRAFT_244304 [Xylona heveae TC161]KZF25459.1 hypothetical protein L228DRAFT_244304 [Xylona heveae TC161]
MSTQEGPASPSHAINTYHCICSQTLLATTYNLSDLPRRQHSGLDKALILPLKSLNADATSNPKSSGIAAAEAGTAGDAEGEDEEDDKQSGDTQSVFVNTVISPKALVVRREDGFEKRVLYRCGRCRVAVGYVLEGERKVVYLLPEGLVRTKEMLEEKGPANEIEKMIPLIA